jgi:hypothetical protein
LVGTPRTTVRAYYFDGATKDARCGESSDDWLEGGRFPEVAQAPEVSRQAINAGLVDAKTCGQWGSAALDL